MTTNSEGRVDAFLLTNNPQKWDLDAEQLVEWVEATAGGHEIEGRWSTGSTTRKIAPGDRAFLLRQGRGKRGIFASGTFVSGVRKRAHWNGRGGKANYADVLWDTVLDPDDMLPIERLFSELPEGQWEPQASGSQVKAGVVERLEELWAEHVVSIRGSAPTPPSTSGKKSGSKTAEGQGRRLDVKLRKELEDLAQDRLTKAYEADGWHVDDRRVGNSYDARATAPDGSVLYLEAKGTTGEGASVIVTRREVEWARDHEGECVIGILSGVEIKPDGTLDTDSGTLRQYLWFPDEEADLRPIQYDFFPPDEAELG